MTGVALAVRVICRQVPAAPANLIQSRNDSIDWQGPPQRYRPPLRGYESCRILACLGVCGRRGALGNSRPPAPPRPFLRLHSTSATDWLVCPQPSSKRCTSYSTSANRLGQQCRTTDSCPHRDYTWALAVPTIRSRCRRHPDGCSLPGRMKRRWGSAPLSRMQYSSRRAQVQH